MRKFKKKKIDRKRLAYTFLFSIFCVFGLTVAYAALSTTLNISGSAEVRESSWNIVIEKYPLEELYGEYYDEMCNDDCVDNYVLMGSAEVIQLPTVTNTSIRDFNLSATLPDDGVIFLYKVTNKGSIPSRLESINYTTPVYSSINNNSNDILWAQNNSLFIASLGTDVDSNDALKVGDIICPGEVRFLMVGFGINDDVTTVPSGAITISNLGVDYNFVQADMNVCQ